MSTNKTENYGLHAWEPEDDFLRSEFNENFEKLDEAVRIVTGRYVGNGAASRFIELGFTPKALLLMNSDGKTYYTGDSYGGLAFPNSPVVRSKICNTLTVVEGGFQVAFQRVENECYVQSNPSGYTFYYLALL